MVRSKHTYGLKLIVLNLLSEGQYSMKDLVKQFEVSATTIKRWKIKYETLGEDSLREATSCISYPKELKLAAVEDYIAGGLSLIQTISKYGITSDSVLMQWVKKYTSHREFKDSNKGMSHSMTKGRKTTLQERIEIISYCIKQHKNYQLTAETYQVSYQQVYQWVKKFEENGEEALRDKRGRTKEEVELTPDEKMKIEMKRLEKENERLRAENLLLKKLEELERRHR
ncbi:transposase [Viridibacillus sp. NPDC093762]|uniref:transposase n=1 Tax=Viridibacillus sp. NPDC093762 TaxID=3390720 RepID=UPI003D0832A9